MLSNSDLKNYDPDDNFFDELYAPFNVHCVTASQMIATIYLFSPRLEEASPALAPLYCDFRMLGMKTSWTMAAPS